MILIARKYGQLGNRLILFAHFIAFARRHGVSVVNPAFDEYAGYFAGTVGQTLCAYPASESARTASPRARRAWYKLTAGLREIAVRLPGVPVIDLGWYARYDLSGPELARRAGGRRIVLADGFYFRDWAETERQREALRGFFAPLPPSAAAADRAMAEARAGSDLVVGVHIRHGDYRAWQGGRHFLEISEYGALMAHVEALFPGRMVTFLVCSTERWNADSFPARRVRFGPGGLTEDLYALSRCDYLLGPESTFSGWASFYGGVPLCFVRRDSSLPTLADFRRDTYRIL